MLREKQPIVIHDRVANLETLRGLWFSANSTTSFALAANPNTLEWIRNKYKYTVLQAEEDTEILLASPSESLKDGVMPENATLVAIQLAAKQVLIVPYRMYYAIPTQKQPINAIGVNDIVTSLLP